MTVLAALTRGDIEWGYGRWSVMLFLMGLACVLAYGSFVGFRS